MAFFHGHAVSGFRLIAGSKLAIDVSVNGCFLSV